MKLGLGTVQFGLDYGVSNTEGKTEIGEVKKIITLAAKSGIEVLDTASGYGESEKVLGKCIDNPEHFHIITKTRADAHKDISSIDLVFEQSLKYLKTQSIYGILLHNTESICGSSASMVYNQLCRLRDAGKVKKIGISVYPEDPVDEILNSYSFDIIQMPLNVLDRRMITNGIYERCCKEGIEIHVRSAFLQGLLLMDPFKAPQWFDPIKDLLFLFHNRLTDAGLNPIQGAYSFIRNFESVSTVLIGVNNSSQLNQNLSDWNKTESIKVSEDLFKGISTEMKEYINPSLWRLR